MERNKWIKEIIESGNTLPVLHPDGNAILAGVRQKLYEDTVTVGPKWLWLAAACAALLIALNAGAISSKNQESGNNSPDAYGFSINNNLY